MRRALLLGLASSATLAQAQTDPRIWLERMSTAVDSVSYIGTFVHITGDETETMRVIHRVDGTDVSERLVSLGGSGREVLRTNEETKCILQAERSVLIDKHAARTPVPLHAALPRNTADLEHYYEFVDHGQDRVAERAAHVVFTEISFPAHIDDSQLASTISDEGFTRQVRDTTAAASPPGEVGWEAGDLPDGFHLSATDNEDEKADGEHLVYSDGLTSVSVFIESLRDSKPMHGFRMVGGSSAFSTTKDGFQVTVVGEVPEPTARRIGDSMRPLALDGQQ